MLEHGGIPKESTEETQALSESFQDDMTFKLNPLELVKEEEEPMWSEDSSKFGDWFLYGE